MKAARLKTLLSIMISLSVVFALPTEREVEKTILITTLAGLSNETETSIRFFDTEATSKPKQTTKIIDNKMNQTTVLWDIYNDNNDKDTTESQTEMDDVSIYNAFCSENPEVFCCKMTLRAPECFEY